MAGKSDDKDDQDEFNKRWSGFDFCRLSGVTVLTFILVLAAIILDDLAFASKRSDACDSNLADCTSSSYCKVEGRCGWSKATYKFSKQLISAHSTPQFDPFYFCGPDSQSNILTPQSETVEAVYRKNCYDKDDNIPMKKIKQESCKIYHAGNIWIITCVVSLIVNIFVMLILFPLYCRNKACFPCEWCNNQTFLVLGILYTIMWVCNLIGAGYFLAIQKCDDANVYHHYNFTQPIVNVMSYSTGLVLIAMVMNCVACGAVCFCWGDNRKYGEDPDDPNNEYAIKPSSRKDPFKATEDKDDDEEESE